MTRADTERTHQRILEAAQRILAADPATTMADVAEAAGVARTTVHRRFATREALVEAMSRWSARQLHDAVEAGYAESSGHPLIALYRVIARVLDVKIAMPEHAQQAADAETTRLRTERRSAAASC